MGLRSVLRTACRVTPTSRWYGLRRYLLVAQGFQVAASARVTSSVNFMVGSLAIGDETFVGHRLQVYGGRSSTVMIGAACDIGPDVCILAGTHELAGPSRRAGVGVGTDVVIEDGCWIGGRALLVGPCRIGRGTVVAAGAIVRCDVPPNSLYFGPRSVDIRPLGP